MVAAATATERIDPRQLHSYCFPGYAFAADPERVERLTGVNEVLRFSLSGLSKVAGLPQMKLGWIVTGGPSGRARSGHGTAGADCRHLSFGGDPCPTRASAPARSRREYRRANPPPDQKEPGYTCSPRRRIRRTVRCTWRADGTILSKCLESAPKKSGRFSYWTAVTSWCNLDISTTSIRMDCLCSAFLLPLIYLSKVWNML